MQMWYRATCLKRFEDKKNYTSNSREIILKLKMKSVDWRCTATRSRNMKAFNK